MSSSAMLSPARVSTAAAESVLSDLFALLERLADVLSDSNGSETAVANPEFETVICGLIAHLRARGATGTEVAARLTQLVERASGQDRSADETAARVASVVAWCRRAERSRP